MGKKNSMLKEKTILESFQEKKEKSGQIFSFKLGGGVLTFS